MPVKTVLLVAAVILLNVAGNFALGWGMKHLPAESGALAFLGDPAAMAGVVLLITWTLTRMQLLGQADLSWVLPVTSIGYVLNALAGALFLNEQVSGLRWLGTLLIVAGSSLVGITAAEPES